MASISTILDELEELCSRAQYRDRDALRLVEEIYQIILTQTEAAAIAMRPLPGASR